MKIPTRSTVQTLLVGLALGVAGLATLLLVMFLKGDLKELLAAGVGTGAADVNARYLDGYGTATSVTANKVYISEGTTGYAPDNTVDTGAIVDGTVSAADIADGSIGAADIADGSIGYAKLASSAKPTITRLTSDVIFNYDTTIFTLPVGANEKWQIYVSILQNSPSTSGCIIYGRFLAPASSTCKYGQTQVASANSATTSCGINLEVTANNATRLIIYSGIVETGIAAGNVTFVMSGSYPASYTHTVYSCSYLMAQKF